MKTKSYKRSALCIAMLASFGAHAQTTTTTATSSGGILASSTKSCVSNSGGACASVAPTTYQLNADPNIFEMSTTHSTGVIGG